MCGQTGRRIRTTEINGAPRGTSRPDDWASDVRCEQRLLGDQRPESGDAPATVRRLHGGAGTYRPGPPNRLSSFVSWLRKPSADMHIRQAADGHQSRISSDGWLDLTSEKGRKELAALRLVESSP